MSVLIQRSPSERRLYPRIAAPLLVRYGTANATNPGYALDISEGGLGFTGEEPEPVGCEVRIRFKWDAPLGEWFDVRAVVRYSQGKKMGVQFLDLKESVKIKLVEMIYQEMTRRRN